MKTTLMNILKIACAGLMLLFIAPAAHAESALAWLPFGIEAGKPLPDKAKRRLTRQEFAKEFYTLAGKFIVYVPASRGNLVELFYISSDPGGFEFTGSLPKRWVRLGMRLCTKNQKGSSLEAMRAMAKKEGAKYIESGSNYVKFEIANKYKYRLIFYTGYDDAKKYCKGGMGHLEVTEGDGEEY